MAHINSILLPLIIYFLKWGHWRQIAHSYNCFSQVGENRYTFGTSKTVRMVRQHGTSVVVRVGGGWEYLVRFLAKVDPCRAKELTQDYLNRLVLNSLQWLILVKLKRLHRTILIG